MITKCDELGHEWRVTTAPGWFQCQRAVGYAPKTNKVVLCKMCAVCPGCLGYAIAGMLNLFCLSHRDCLLEDFLVSQLTVSTAPVEHSSYEQSSLW